MTFIQTALLFTWIALGGAVGLIYALFKEIDSLRGALKQADRRYAQLYAAYSEECSSNTNRPRVTTMTQGNFAERNHTMAQTQWDYLNKYGNAPHTEDPRY